MKRYWWGGCGTIVLACALLTLARCGSSPVSFNPQDGSTNDGTIGPNDGGPTFDVTFGDASLPDSQPQHTQTRQQSLARASLVHHRRAGEQPQGFLIDFRTALDGGTPTSRAVRPSPSRAAMKARPCSPIRRTATCSFIRTASTSTTASTTPRSRTAPASTDNPVRASPRSSRPNTARMADRFTSSASTTPTTARRRERSTTRRSISISARTER